MKRVDVSAAANDVGAAGGSVVVVFGPPPWLKGREISGVGNEEVQG